MSNRGNADDLTIDIIEPEAKSFWKFLLKAALLLALGLGVFFATGWAFEPSWYQVQGTSMFPNLLHGDNCLVMNRDLGQLVDIRRNDVVVLEDEHREKFLVKRVVGLPGDTIEFRLGRLFVNGQKEVRLDLLLNMTIGPIKPRVLGDDEYYILGDNRKDSHDSRAFGPVSREQIEGVVFWRWRSPRIR